ncbi:hypothetical protein OIU79_029512 [Salix purpurea]|uniref:Uncharacterized protein n=1 Tax=Salix purpurea TaxID=77065 RepID=A0A9Q0ZVK0_SALPP|nr:hypothetical protein OIU79_029512 [Salix purpurea]
MLTILKMDGRKPLVCSFPAGFRYRPGSYPIHDTWLPISELPDHCAGRLTTSIISDMAHSRFLVYFRKIESFICSLFGYSNAGTPHQVI